MNAKLNHFQSHQTIEEENFKRLFEIKQGLIRPNYEFTPLNYSFDVKFKSGETFFIGEIKVRTNEYNKDYFLKEGAYIEYGKFEGIYKKQVEIKYKKKKDVTMLYLHFTSDGYCLVFKLEEPCNYDFGFYTLPKDMYEPQIKIKKLATKLFDPIEIINLNK